jgi:hypothetical protein
MSFTDDLATPLKLASTIMKGQLLYFESPPKKRLLTMPGLVDFDAITSLYVFS